VATILLCIQLVNKPSAVSDSNQSNWIKITMQSISAPTRVQQLLGRPTISKKSHAPNYGEVSITMGRSGLPSTIMHLSSICNLYFKNPT